MNRWTILHQEMYIQGKGRKYKRKNKAKFNQQKNF